MTTAIKVTLTDSGLLAMAKGAVGSFGGLPVKNVISYFVFGEGGYLPATVISETIGTGNGVQKSFSATLANVPAERGTVTVVSGAVVATDDGQGTLSGSGVSGTVTYKGGQVNVTFDVAPAAAAPVVAGYDYRAVPKDPDRTRILTEAQESPSDPADILHRAFFVKHFGDDATATTTVSASPSPRAVCVLFLDLFEFIDDGRGEPPTIFEAGVFDSEDQMLAYATLGPDMKDGSTSVSRTIRFVW